jgi:hypothetical protein
MAANGSQAVVAVGSVQSSLPAPELEVLDTQTKAIGVIVPPHHIRQVVDKTADFVAKNGVVSACVFGAVPESMQCLSYRWSCCSKTHRFARL